MITLADVRSMTLAAANKAATVPHFLWNPTPEQKAVMEATVARITNDDATAQAIADDANARLGG